MLRVFIEKAGLSKSHHADAIVGLGKGDGPRAGRPGAGQEQLGPMKTEAATPPARAETGGRVAAAQPSPFSGELQLLRKTRAQVAPLRPTGEEGASLATPLAEPGGGPPADCRGTTGKGEKKYGGKGERKERSGNGEKKRDAHAGEAWQRGRQPEIRRGGPGRGRERGQQRRGHG